MASRIVGSHMTLHHGWQNVRTNVMATAAGISASLELTQMKLRYEESTDRKKLELPRASFSPLKSWISKLCKELHVKVGDTTKAELVRCLLSWWLMGLFAVMEDSTLAEPSALISAVQQELADLSLFEFVQEWTKILLTGTQGM